MICHITKVRQYQYRHSVPAKQQTQIYIKHIEEPVVIQEWKYQLPSIPIDYITGTPPVRQFLKQSDSPWQISSLVTMNSPSGPNYYGR